MAENPGASSSNPAADAKGGAQNEQPPSQQVQYRHPTLLEALKAFKDAQQRRVAHWAEYDEAMEAFFSPAARKSQRRGPVNGSQNLQPEDTPSQEQNQDAHDEHHQHPHDEGPRAIDEGVMAQILRLVTSGLLECSHEVRAIQIELAAPASADNTSASAATDDGKPFVESVDGQSGKSVTDTANGAVRPPPRPAELIRPDLAAVIGSVQDLENALLRKTVERDQARRKQSLEGVAGGSSNEHTLEYEQAQKEIRSIRSSIMEKMQEINAEIADLS